MFTRRRRNRVRRLICRLAIRDIVILGSKSHVDPSHFRDDSPVRTYVPTRVRFLHSHRGCGLGRTG